jgi:hypothetical protein
MFTLPLSANCRTRCKQASRMSSRTTIVCPSPEASGLRRATAHTSSPLSATQSTLNSCPCQEGHQQHRPKTPSPLQHLAQ